MSKYGHYIAGLSVVAVLGGNPQEAQTHEYSDNDKVENKTEYVHELKTDATKAWQLVDESSSIIGSEKNHNDSIDKIKRDMKDDASFSYATIEEVGRAPRIDGLEYQESYSDDRADRVGGYYSSETRTITDIDNEGDGNKGVAELALLAHEAQHMHQYSVVNFDADMSLSQHYKLHSYSEIGASIAEVLQIREMYKDAKTDEERENALKDTPLYYRNAIESGEINPLSSDMVDFDREMSLIANETTNAWMQANAENYDKNHVDMVCSETAWTGVSIKPNDDNYKEGVSRCMTMGGIDFSQYLEKDIECYNNTVVRADEFLANGGSREKALYCIRSNENEEVFNQIDVNVDEGLKGFSNYQKYQLTMQKALVNYLKENRKGRLSGWVNRVKDGEIIDENVDDVCSKITEKYWSEFIAKGAALEVDVAKDGVSFSKANDKEFQAKMREIWTVETNDGEKVCLLDGMSNGEAPNWAYCYPAIDLKKQDETKFLGKVFSAVKDKLGINNKNEKEGIEGENNAINNVDRQGVPDYEAVSSPTRSEVMVTNDVIDTRTDYLVKEREERVKATVNRSIDFIENRNARKSDALTGVEQDVQQNDNLSQQQNKPSQQQVLNQMVNMKQNSL